MMFHLNVQDNNEDVQAYVTKPTLVIKCVRTLHFTRQYRHLSREIDEFDVILFEIY